jgi:hypothetical protein
MCAHSSHSNSRDDVRASEPLESLRQWIGRFNRMTRDRGDDYFRESRVERVVSKGDSIRAIVRGKEEYFVVITFEGRRWRSECSCPMVCDCKHVAAAAFAWMAANGLDPRKPTIDHSYLYKASPPTSALPTMDRTGVNQPRKHSFREQWSPVLAEKLGRSLTESEAQRLGQLSALFTEFRQSHCSLRPSALRHYGFSDAIPRSHSEWEPLFNEWWSANPPADPWAFWQYIAYGLEQNGCSIPEVFKPLTDTSVIHAVQATEETQKHLAVWRQAFSMASHWSPSTPAVSALRQGVRSIRVRVNEVGRFLLELQSAPDKPWKEPTKRWLEALQSAGPADFENFTPAEAAVMLALLTGNRFGYSPQSLKFGLDDQTVARLTASRTAHPAIVLADGSPFTIAPEPLFAAAEPSPNRPDQLDVNLVTPDGTFATAAQLLTIDPEPLYFYRDRVWRGPPPLPNAPLPIAAMADPELVTTLQKIGVRLPQSLELKYRRVTLQPKLRLWLEDGGYSSFLCAELLAGTDDPPCEQRWLGYGGWQWTEGRQPPARRADEAMTSFDLSAAEAVAATFAEFRLQWAAWSTRWERSITRAFPDEFTAWRATLPASLPIEASTELAGLLNPPLRASVDFSALPADSSHDWFDITVALRVEDTTLTSEEIALLLKARGKWVQLPRRGWQRLELEEQGKGATAAVLDRLGLDTVDLIERGKPAAHRVHLLQLVSESGALEAKDAALAAALRDRVAKLAAVAAPAIPERLQATLRPYQCEGFHFLAQLSANRLGGVLADDMGLGKTVQALAWLLHLASGSGGRRPKFRALVVCPKSVTHGWLSEAGRFAPALKTELFVPAIAEREPKFVKAQLLVGNYTQLRLHADWFASGEWDAVILDEGQFIKNATSQVAAAARGLSTKHRLVLTGTPIENRLTDLWSIFAFAQPGLLGQQTGFRRQYPEKDSAALSRLHRRVRHFMLRRTKAQAAPDLPARTEDELVVELEPGQRKLYDAELKRARRQLLGLENDRALDKVRFNILASLLRLRQICCHPVLVDPAHAEMPSAKLEALIERLEELRDEGHQVLVFSQFVEMLELIRERLVTAEIGHLMLTGATQNRAALVDLFQTDRSKTVFLLSLKAAGFGLNLTAASYAILYDPWWNPAVEAQAIDRTHRIGQSKPVFGYRLIARNTVEEKIRALQREKAELAAAVVQEETLAKVLDLESLRRILS